MASGTNAIFVPMLSTYRKFNFAISYAYLDLSLLISMNNHEVEMYEN